LRWKATENYVAGVAGSMSHGVIGDISEHTKLNRQLFPSGDPPLHKRKIEDIQAEILSNASKLHHDQIIANLRQLNVGEWTKLMLAVNGKTS